MMANSTVKSFSFLAKSPNPHLQNPPSIISPLEVPWIQKPKSLPAYVSTSESLLFFAYLFYKSAHCFGSQNNSIPNPLQSNMEEKHEQRSEPSKPRFLVGNECQRQRHLGLRTQTQGALDALQILSLGSSPSGDKRNSRSCAWITASQPEDLGLRSSRRLPQLPATHVLNKGGSERKAALSPGPTLPPAPAGLLLPGLQSAPVPC